MVLRFPLSDWSHVALQVNQCCHSPDSGLFGAPVQLESGSPWSSRGGPRPPGAVLAIRCGPSGVLQAFGRAAPPVLAVRLWAEPDAEGAVREPCEASVLSDPPGLTAGTVCSRRADYR